MPNAQDKILKIQILRPTNSPKAPRGHPKGLQKARRAHGPTSIQKNAIKRLAIMPHVLQGKGNKIPRKQPTDKIRPLQKKHLRSQWCPIKGHQRALSRTSRATKQSLRYMQKTRTCIGLPARIQTKAPLHRPLPQDQ